MLIQVGQPIGVWWTIALLIADSILGSLLMRSQGRAVWRRFNVTLQAGRPPAREVLDGVLVIFGGALLLTPGFISDFLGLLLLLPPTRALVRAMLVRRFADRMIASATRGRRSARRPPARGRARRRRGHGGRRRRRRAAAGLRVSEPVLTGRRRVHRRRHLRVRRPRRRLLRARAARASPEPRALQGSALGVLFAGREPVGVLAEGDNALGADADWDELRMPGLVVRSLEPHAAGRSRSTRRRRAASTSSSRRCRRRPSSRRTTTRRASAAWPATSSCAASPAPRPGTRSTASGQRGRTLGHADWDRIALDALARAPGSRTAPR